MKIIFVFGDTKRGDYLKKQIYNIAGMTCSNCSEHVNKAVKLVNGVQDVSVNLLTNSMKVTFDDLKTDDNTIMQAVSNAGYSASLSSDKASKKAVKPSINGNAILKRLVFSVVFLVLLMIVSMGSMVIDIFKSNMLAQGITELLLVIPILILNKQYFSSGVKSCMQLNPNMDTLIALGSGVSVIYSIYQLYALSYAVTSHQAMMHGSSPHFYFEAAGMILTFITIGKYLESKSKGKTTDAISQLMALAPNTALIETDNKEVEVSTDAITAGTTVIVKNGMSIPCDGTVKYGSCTVDESALTGESIPCDKITGDKVTGGTILKSGYIKFTAEKVGSETTLSKIVSLVADASATKAPIARMADTVAKFFVPAVILLSMITLLVWTLTGHDVGFSLSFAIAVLVISCPCALGLATPTAIMVATGKAAQNGILIKTAETLETAGKLNTVIFDKTGTITYGKPKVTDVKAYCEIDKNKLIQIAVSMERLSEHPLAKAVCNEFATYESLQTNNFENKIGFGISAEINGKKYFSGNTGFINDSTKDVTPCITDVENFARQGKTALIFADEEKVLGVIAVADEIKKSANKAVNELENMNIQTVMLTGDNEFSAHTIQEKAGIKTAYAKVLPQDKEAILNSYKESGKVAMIGDGINDSPALAGADVGIAIGTGTDIAIDSADAVLMKDDLNNIVTAVKLSRATIRNIKENLFWAFIYNVIFIPVAAGVFFPSFSIKLDPMYGTIAMSLSSICVVLNALRLKEFKPKPEKNRHKKTDTTEYITIVPENRKENINMKKVQIDGMMCEHCKAAVTKALNSIEGADAQVSLATGIAEVKGNVSDAAIKKAVEDAGYKIINISK